MERAPVDRGLAIAVGRILKQCSIIEGCKAKARKANSIRRIERHRTKAKEHPYTVDQALTIPQHFFRGKPATASIKTSVVNIDGVWSATARLQATEEEAVIREDASQPILGRIVCRQKNITSEDALAIAFSWISHSYDVRGWRAVPIPEDRRSTLRSTVFRVEKLPTSTR
jgi:hypothetical protein